MRRPASGCRTPLAACTPRGPRTRDACLFASGVAAALTATLALLHGGALPALLDAAGARHGTAAVSTKAQAATLAAWSVGGGVNSAAVPAAAAAAPLAACPEPVAAPPPPPPPQPPSSPSTSSSPLATLLAELDALLSLQRSLDVPAPAPTSSSAASRSASAGSLDASLAALGEGPFPAPSSARCRMAADGFELCEYTNVCLEQQSGYQWDRAVSYSGLVFLYDDAAGPGATPRRSKWSPAEPLIKPVMVETAGRFNREDAPGAAGAHAFDAAAEAAAALEAALARVAGGDANTDAAAAATQLLTARRRAASLAALRLAPHSVNWTDVLDEPASAKNDFMFSDITGEHAGVHPRLLPVESLYRVAQDHVSSAVPDAYGGTYAGGVSWVDSLYLGTQDNLINPWLFHSTVTGPLLGAAYLNASMGLSLPPLEFVHLSIRFLMDLRMAQEHGTPFHPRSSARFPYQWGHLLRDAPALGDMVTAFKWGAQMLWHTLGGLAAMERRRGAGAGDAAAGEEVLPFLGSSRGPPPPADFPYRAFVDRFTAECIGAGGAPTAATHFCAQLLALQKATGGLPASAAAPVLPFSALRLRPGGEGNAPGAPRVAWSDRDFPPPLHPRPAAIPEGTPHRICARRAVALGTRYNLVGGATEALWLRRWAQETLGLAPWPHDAAHVLPPRKAIVVDRMTADWRLPGHRSIFRRAELVDAKLKAAGIEYEVLTNDALADMPLAEQVQRMSSSGLLVATHGAALVNSLFMPRRSVVIELFPFNLLCPVFWKMHMAAGHFYLPVFSRLKGSTLTYTFLNRMAPADLPAFIARCDGGGLGGAVADFDCFTEYRFQEMLVPEHEFHHTLTQALSLMGLPQPTGATALDKLHGIPPAQPNLVPHPDFYTNHTWVLCPPASTCSGGGGGGA